MKRAGVKKLLQRQWVVPIAAMVLTLAIGSFAIAGANGSGNYSYNPDASTTTVTEFVDPALTSTTFPTMPVQLTEDTVAGSVGTPATDAATLAAEQAKENAILDLIREKMTPEDQTVFDQLRNIAASQQQALNQAQADLQATKQQLKALIDKYLNVGSGQAVSGVENAAQGVTSDLGLNLVTGLASNSTLTTAPGSTVPAS